MESLGKILATISSPTQQSERPSESILLAAEAKYREMLHRTNCLRCTGQARDNNWPCDQDPEYEPKRACIKAGVPYPAIMTFETFTRRKGTEIAFMECTNMALDPQGWVTLLGSFGSGKTHLALAAVYALLAQGKYGWFITAGGLLDRWRSWFSDEERDFSERFEADCSRSSLVVVDDLGSERGTEWALERLTMFLDHRYGRDLPTIITTNYPKRILARHSGGRIADRVFDRSTGKVRVVMMDCTSYRTGAY